MDSPRDKSASPSPKILPGREAVGAAVLGESALVVGSDRLYQIAALTAGIILLATAF